jgi:nucleoside-diphosphate-sugar epimerase
MEWAAMTRRTSKILVTGAGGFVGQFVARGLHHLGYQVRASGRSQSPPSELQQAGIEWRQTELSNELACRALVSDCGWVLHCAGKSSPVGRWEDFARDNLVALRCLIRASSRVEGFVYLSSSGVYFHGQSGLEARHESHPLPESYPAYYHYLWSKRLAEEILRESALPWIIVRPRAIYGPGDRSLFPRIRAQLMRGSLPIIGDGRNLTSLTHVQHLFDLMLLLLESQSDLGQTVWNICDGDPVDLWGLFQQIADKLGAPPLRRRTSVQVAYRLAHLLEMLGQISAKEPRLTRYTVDLLSQSQTLDISRARTKLGFQPRFTSLEGVFKTLDHR